MIDGSVTRVDERLAGVEWPGIRKVTVPAISSEDCVLLCAGFEDRSVETARRISETKSAGLSVGLLTYLPELRQNRQAELRRIGRLARFKVTEFVYDRVNPAGMGDQLREFSRSFRSVVVDVSGMSRLLIVQTVVALIREEKMPVSLIYAMAKEYPPSQARFEDDRKDNKKEPVSSYLSTGILEIAVTPELGAVSMLGEPVRLVAFPSFDPAQLTNLIQELQPTYAEFIHGTPPRKNDKWRTKAIRDLNHRALRELQGTKEHETSTLDYRETLNTLLQIYADRSMFDRLVVAPTGSKMQAVAVGLFRAALHDVQIVYPTPQVFAEPEEYTVGVRQLYQLDLPTEAISDAIKNVEAEDNEPDSVSL